MGRGGGGSRAKGGGGGGRAATSSNASAAPSTGSGGGSIHEQLQQAYAKLSGGMENKRVYISDIRNELKGFSRDQVDRALDAAASNGKASLFQLDSPRDITPERAAGAFHTPSGNKRHIIYMGGRKG